METSLDLLAWRGSLADASAVPSATVLAEWAGQLARAGLEAEAALLSDVAALHQGFSPQAQAAREACAPAFGRRAPSASQGMLDQAMADLRRLTQLIGSFRRHGVDADPAPRSDTMPAEIPDIIETARRLRGLLDQAWPDGPEEHAPTEHTSTEHGRELAATLASLAGAGRRLATLDYRLFAVSPLATLVPAIATVGLIDFALSTRDLWGGALGSPMLFHQAARFDEAGLGPYLRNVGRLARNSRDVIELAQLAQADASNAGVGIGFAQWMALLTRGCRNGLLHQIVDDLGDSDAGEALLLILDQVASRLPAAIDQDMVRLLRDAGLDNADCVLAARAQQVIMRVSPDNQRENVVLGSIEASRGEFTTATAIFEYALVRAPDDADLRERLAAAKAGNFGAFTLPYGFTSPADRRDWRLRRRGVAPEYPRRRGERIPAVDVG